MTLITPKPVDPGQETYEGYCGTSYAAKLLGMSVGTVQGLVEKNELKAWKTQGGHRRISLQSIHDYQRQHQMAASMVMREEERLRLMVVEDDAPTRAMLQSHFDQWQVPLDVVMYPSAVDALLDMASVHPDVLMTDLRMAHIDGFELLRRLNQHHLWQQLSVIVMTGMSASDIEESGGLSEGVHVMHKPIDLDWLKGFLEALISMRRMGKRARMGATAS